MTALYEDRLRRVLRYIYDHTAEDLSLDTLADVAALSRFHFHRVYHAMTGETATQAVRRIRLYKASALLAQGRLPVDKIAAHVGYDNPQSFNRAFKAQYGMTPLTFRNTGHVAEPGLTFRTGDPTMTQSEIRALPETRLAALPHQGPYSEIGRAFTQIAAVFSARALWAQARGMAGVYYDSPADVAPEDLRSHAGVKVEEGFDMPETLQEVRLPAGDHLVVTYKGPYSGLQAAWDHAYCQALPNSGRLPGHSAPFEIYLNDPTDTPPAELLTEITIPLASQ